MADAEGGAMVEALFTCRADAAPRITLEDFPADRMLAGDAHTIRSVFESIESCPQFIQLRIAFERKECIDLVKIQSPIIN